MNITKSYKTLDLKTGASIDDARKAYKDMVRVWHPDRFAGNPRLRAKANEKLKEVNLAYGEIKFFLANDFLIHADTGESAHKEGAVRVDHKARLFPGKILGFPFSFFHSLITNTNIKKYYHELMSSKNKERKIPSKPSGQHNRKLHNSSVTKRARRTKRIHFSEILEEVARSKKKKVTYAEENSKGKQL
jgi:curved DNA-binding protein CbpA